MTSEVAVMNKQGIALAADSAVTFRKGMGQKIFTSASKIFTLSKYQPVGVMIYGNADFMELPWETIIKIYRNGLGPYAFKTVRNYAEDFLTFLREDDPFFFKVKDLVFSDENQERYVVRTIYRYFSQILEDIFKDVERFREEGEKVDVRAIMASTERIVQSHSELWNDADLVSSVPESFGEDFLEKYGAMIRQAEDDVFEELPLSNESSDHLMDIAISLFSKFSDSEDSLETSGVVFAGFGSEDMFPVLESYEVEGRIGNYLKHRRIEKDCREIGVSTNATIIPFAQREMVDTFMAGVDPGYQLLIEGFVEQLCSSFPQFLLDNMDRLLESDREDLLDDLTPIAQDEFFQFVQKLLEYRERKHIDPVMSVVQGLPKDELAAMAESLVNLTSFKRRVSMQAETVGGPIDVAVISKGDGFIWIKRKHYFEGERNPQFLANYYREDQSNDD